LKTITIIDTFGFFFRSYFALPPLRNSDGFPTGLLTGFINLIDSLKRDYDTDYILFALDSKGDTFRHEKDPNYKANRDSPPKELLQQLPIAIEWIEQMGFATLSKDRYEADDVIATITRLAKADGLRVRILSHDKDLYQLIDDDKVILLDSVKKIEIDESACIKKFGVKPKDFTNFQAIVGDTADNIVGVKGIGVKGASKLINQFGTIEQIYQNISLAGTPRIQKLLLEYKESLFLSRELVTLKDDIFKDYDLESYIFEDKNYLTPLIDEFERFEMRQAIAKAKVGTEYGDTTPPKPTISFTHTTLDTKDKLFSIIDNIVPNTIVAFDTETTGLDTKEANMVGFSFCIDEKSAYYVPISHSYLGVEEQVDIDDALEAIKSLMRYKIVGQNLKFDLSLLYNRYNFLEYIPYADTMILAWLINPSRKVGLDTLAQRYFEYKMKPFKEMVKKGENFSSVDIDSASFYASEDAWMTRLIYFEEIEEIEKHLLDVAREVEYPFINILSSMERVGIRVDIDRLESLNSELTQTLKGLTEEIYTLAGSEFNIKSTQQLGAILFGELGLKGGKKTKRGYSTNESVLKSLLDSHPIIPKILSYRESQKILSTYIKPLAKLAMNDKNSRIYTSFIQTGTATGRLSSRNPNLQNIPVRSALGRSVREAFVARDGYRLVGIDYSQIELRLLAHYSQDEALVEAFRRGDDIHLATAIKLFGEDEAKQKRSFAKSINFGLLYGMGSRKLSDELGITTAKAREIIESYFSSFPTVKSFLESIQEDVKERGFVETIKGRRRLFDYDNANGMQKASFMRESVNTLFQGSASDLIKLSMIEIDRVIKEEKLDAYMLLQIHDELIFEIQEDRVEVIGNRFRDIMESIITLKVPLECSVSVGDNWGELK
jgi:DNA polymerase-1